MKDILVDGFKIICHGAQTSNYKRRYCEYCPLLVRAKYPPQCEFWRVWGIMQRGDKCNIKNILNI